MTYLDLCLQGLISPSTLGIDTKKIQDANAQYERQMEKTTMYTRQGIIEALTNFIPKLVNTVLKMRKQLSKQPAGEDIKIEQGIIEYVKDLFNNTSLKYSDITKEEQEAGKQIIEQIKKKNTL